VHKDSAIRARGFRTAFVALLALFVLNSLLSFGPLWPTPAIVLQLKLSPEMMGLWFILLWLGYRASNPNVLPSKRVLWLLSTLVLCLVVGRYADVTVPSLFGRPISLYWDVPQIPRFLWVSAINNPWWVSMAAVLATAAIVWALLSFIHFCLRVVLQTTVPWALQSHRAWLLAFIASVFVAAHVAYVPGTGRYVSNAILPNYIKQARLLWDAHTPGTVAYALPTITPVEDALASHGPNVFSALGHRDVSIIFLESFGAVLFDQAEARAATEPSRQKLQEVLQATGRQVVSGFFRSPTIGGASDLAHMAVLSGVDLSDPRRHELLLTTKRPTLMHLFKQAGYQTFGVYHAVSWVWPEHVHYGFDRYLDGPALDYQGPPITFWKIPDQIALARYEQQHPRTASSPPRALFFPTISSHFPFNPVPPYQPDWQRALTSTPFEAADVEAAHTSTTNWLDMRKQYWATVNYVYTWLGGYFALPEPRETIYILIGDHQPTANITGENVSWDVPVHIISRDRVLLDRFKTHGFSDGLSPSRQVLGGLHHLTSLLLSGFGPSQP
jgi:Sulfatase